MRLIGGSGAAERADRTASWIAAHSLADGLDALARAGLAAAPVLSGASVLRERGVRAGNPAMVDIPGDVLVKGFPFQLDRLPLAVQRDSPAVGADTKRC
ncbi:MAG: CoA transferase [Acetobacteraceae bacterium]